MEFKVYSHDEVKDKLNFLFGHKCAYCESNFAPMMPVDVEHFRPKGGVVTPDGNLRFPGYWWLASKWDNLLPSCIDCNRSRWHKVGEVTYKRGKENLFPLRNGDSQAIDEAGVAGEFPLLINPAEDHPDHHLHIRYLTLPDGREESVMQPIVNAGVEDPKGRASIDTYGLNRHLLAEARRERVKLMISAIVSAERFFQLAEAEADEEKAALMRGMGRQTIRQLAKDYLHWKKPYSAACRAYFREWLDDLRQRVPDI